jgi:hypothetical protein
MNELGKIIEFRYNLIGGGRCKAKGLPSKRERRENEERHDEIEKGQVRREGWYEEELNYILEEAKNIKGKSNKELKEKFKTNKEHWQDLIVTKETLCSHQEQVEKYWFLRRAHRKELQNFNEADAAEIHEWELGIESTYEKKRKIHIDWVKMVEKRIKECEEILERREKLIIKMQNDQIQELRNAQERFAKFCGIFGLELEKLNLRIVEQARESDELLAGILKPLQKFYEIDLKTSVKEPTPNTSSNKS